jgi:hypothetical protein
LEFCVFSDFADLLAEDTIFWGKKDFSKDKQAITGKIYSIVKNNLCVDSKIVVEK